MIKYIPSYRIPLPRPLNVSSAWKGIEEILPSLVQDFHVDTSRAIEFGIEAGFSIAALANYFNEVIGVDTFAGDIHTHFHDPVETFSIVENNLKDYPNIELNVSNYKDWIKKDNSNYGLCHIDIVHTYNETYECGKWAIEHADVIIFHDTLSFSEVMRAVTDLASFTGQVGYNFEEHHGLGILRKR